MKSSTPSRRAVAILLTLIMVLSLAPGVVAAQSLQGVAGTFVVEEGETVSSVQGLAGTIVVRGTVTGDVSGASGSLVVAETGVVQGDLSGAGGTVRVAGHVAGDVSVAGGAVTVTESGRIDGSLSAGAGTITIDGTIGGNAKVSADTITVGPSAQVGGELRWDAGTFDRSEDARIDGRVIQDESIGNTRVTGFGLPSVPGLWFGYGLLVNLLLGAVLLGVLPRFSEGVARRVADAPLRTGGIGLLALIGTPIALVLIAITIIGIPITVIGFILYALGLWIAYVYGAYAVGTWTLERLDRDHRWLALVGGLLGIAILARIPVLGGLLEFIVLLLGLGAIAVGLIAAYRGRDEGDSESPRQATLSESGAGAE